MQEKGAGTGKRGRRGGWMARLLEGESGGGCRRVDTRSPRQESVGGLCVKGVNMCFPRR